MKKYVFVALATAILLAITGCNRNGNTQEELLVDIIQHNVISALQPHTGTIYPPTHMLPYSADAVYDGLVDTTQVAPLLPPMQLDIKSFELERYADSIFRQTEEVTCDIEEERIRIKFPGVADMARYIALDNGTLVDKRLFDDLYYKGLSYDDEDLWLIFDLIIRHFKYMEIGDEELLFSTMFTMDGSDANHFHPAILNLMDAHRGTSLFVERITLSSAGFFIRVVISNAEGEEFHVWPFVQSIITVYAPGYESETWLISRYFNHVGDYYWIIYHTHLWEYAKRFK